MRCRGAFPPSRSVARSCRTRAPATRWRRRHDRRSSPWRTSRGASNTSATSSASSSAARSTRSWRRRPDVSKRSIALRLNDIDRTVEIEDQTTMLEMVRVLGYVGAKLSCDMEVCGACTVLLEGRPISSCTTLAVEADGRSVQTVESLADGPKLHPLQEAFIDKFAFQCGYCTPGMIMSAKALLDENPKPTREEIIHHMDGNICRCTGYVPIVAAIQRAAEALAKEKKA